MADDLDPYGLLEQTFQEATSENIEDISPANSPTNDENRVEVEESNSNFAQRSFIAHKDMKNIDFESTEDQNEDEEEHEKLQFDFDVPSPAFEAISDEEDNVESKTEDLNVRGDEMRPTPLNSFRTESEVLKNADQVTEPQRNDSVQRLEELTSSVRVDEERAKSVLPGVEDRTANWEPGSGIVNLSSGENSRTTSYSQENEMVRNRDSFEPGTAVQEVSPISEGSSDQVDTVNTASDTDRNDLKFNPEDFIFKDNNEPSRVIEEEGNDGHEVEAPIPSPFSDFGDISGPETAIISDILKGTEDGIPGLDSKEKTECKESETVTEPIYSEKDETISQLTEEKQSDAEESLGIAGVPAEQDVGGLIADIFGESDDEEEEFEGFAEEELYPDRAKAVTKERPLAVISDDEEEDDYERESQEDNKLINTVKAIQEEESSDDEVDDLKPRKEEMVSDFDLMMQRKKEMNRSQRRSRRDFDIINDNDDIIAAMIKQMKEAAEEDRLLNQAGQAATKKLKLLPSVIAHLRKANLQHTFIDCGILPVIKEWLQPLPDNSLPHLQIRTSLLRALAEFPPLDKGALKLSGVGRSIMLLFKHPKEVRQNRRLAGKIIAEWARPIFGVTTKFTDMSREDRQERDKMSVPAVKKRRLSSAADEPGLSRPIDQALQDGKTPRRPGDKGFVGRARVPMPSNRDYVVRPKSNVEFFDMGKGQKKLLSRYDQQVRKYKDRMGSMGQAGSRAVGISLNGSKMTL